MKIETNNSTDTTLKTKTEKANDYQIEDGFAFRDILEKGLLGTTGLMQNFNNDFVINDFISQTQNDIKGLKSSYSYDCLTMDRDDAMFFANSIKGGEFSFNIKGELQMLQEQGNTEAIAKTYKSAEVSKTLMDMLSSSMSKNKAVRVDFGNDISAVLRVDRNGKISAEFIPSDKIAEEYLKNNISYLQQTFSKQDIPYNELTYKRQKDKQNQDQNQNQNEKGDK